MNEFKFGAFLKTLDVTRAQKAAVTASIEISAIEKMHPNYVRKISVV